MQIPDAFHRFRTQEVVAYRSSVTDTGPFGSQSTREEVWSGKGDLQEGPEALRRYETQGVDADAVLYLPDKHPIKTADIVEVAGREWVVEETADLNSALLIKSRD